MRTAILGIVVLCVMLLVRGARAEERRDGSDYVVVVHGMGRTHRSMTRIVKGLREAGYEPINWRYSSLRDPVETHVERLDACIDEHCTNGARQVHFVTHSLGGLIVRAYLKDNPGTNVGRVVMMAPPNQGSRLADITRKLRFSEFFTRKVGMQLGTGDRDLPKRLGPVEFELGVIAGDRSLNPLYSLLEPGKDDGKVAVEKAKVAGMRDFLVVHSTHTFMIQRKYVIDQILHFLNRGKFVGRRPAQ